MSTDAPKTTRARSAKYDVFMLLDLDSGYQVSAAWVLVNDLDEPVTASSRREAIVLATAGLPEEQRYGRFATAKHGEFQPTTRGRKTEPTDVWS